MKLPLSLFIFIAIALGLIFPEGVLLKEFTIPLLFALMLSRVLGKKHKHE
jgi:hypothetical protein